MTFLEIEFGTDAFRKECELRHKVLRLPLGLSLYDEDLSQESQEMHFGLFDEGALVACVIAVALSPAEVKIRQMAVSDERRGQGHGRSVIRCLEKHLVGKGFTHCSMHARITAVGFYEKLDYSRIGSEFIEVGIPHVRMEKCLTGGGLNPPICGGC